MKQRFEVDTESECPRPSVIPRPLAWLPTLDGVRATLKESERAEGKPSRPATVRDGMSMIARGAFVLALLSVAGCRARDERAARPAVPSRLGFVGCAPSSDGGVGGTVTLRVASAGAGASTPPPDAQLVCDGRLDDHLTASFRLRAEPAGAELHVDGQRTDVVTVALLPLVKDELMQHVTYARQLPAVRDEVLARVRARARRKVEVRGADQTGAFEISLEGYELDDPTYAALVREAARAPRASSPDAKKGVILQLASGRTVRAGRERITLADFDWLATETETKRTTLRTCEYERGGSFPLVAVGTKVVVTDRNGARVAEKDFPPATRAECDTSVFTVDGKARTGPMLRYPNASAWLDELAAKDAR